MQQIAGYTEQSDEAVNIVNYNKQVEEFVLRMLDNLDPGNNCGVAAGGVVFCDPRWLSIARTHIEQGFMAMNRAVFQPRRVPISTPIAYPADPPPTSPAST